MKPVRLAGTVSLLVALLAAARSAGAQTWAERLASARLEASPELVALADSPSSPENLMEAALYFSGADAARARELRRLLEPTRAEARAMAENGGEHYARGEAILTLIHDRFLKRYVELETGLDLAVIDGRYNCVSSAALYLIVAAEAGLDALGIVVPDHSLAALRLPDGRLIDVETTNRHGFDPGSKKEFLDSFGKTTGYAYVAPSEYARRTEENARFIIGLIAWNRATLAERRGDNPTALVLAVDAYAYMGGEAARDYLGGRIHNVAALLLNARRWGEALSFLRRAQLVYGSIGDSDRLVAQAELALLAERVDFLAATDPDGAVAQVERAYETGALGEKELAEFVEAIFSRAAESARKKGGWLAAWELLEDAFVRFPYASRLAELARSYRANWVIDTHNRFVSFFNARRYEDARAVLDAAFVLAPDEDTFLKDKAALEAATRQMR